MNDHVWWTVFFYVAYMAAPRLFTPGFAAGDYAGPVIHNTEPTMDVLYVAAMLAMAALIQGLVLACAKLGGQP